jgi:hypothetical protein
MIRRLTALLMVVGALLLLVAPSAAAVTPTSGAQDAPAASSVTFPPGFPDDLKQYVAGTPQFKQGRWFHDPQCLNQGGAIGMYINDVMLNEPRLLYWSAPPAVRLQFWVTDPIQGVPPGADPDKEPPNLPPTFPASTSSPRAYEVPEDICTDSLKKWTTPANNAWGFSWTGAMDAESIAAMSQGGAYYNSGIPLDELKSPCSDQGSPYCSLAFFVDCSTIMPGDQADAKACLQWNVSVGQLFAGLANYIDMNTSFLDRVKQFFGAIGDGVLSAGKWVLNAFVTSIEISAAIAQFVTDPSGAVDDVANSLHQAATDFTTKVLQGLSSVGDFDPGSGWFLAVYAASAGIGVVVMAFMALLMIIRTANGSGAREDLQEALVKYLPMGLFLSAFAPAIAAVLGQTVHGLTDGINAWESSFLVDTVAKIALTGTITSGLVPGGAFIGLLLFLFMVIGTFMVFVGLAIQSIALPLGGAAAGIAWGMWVHPKWRRKALRLPLTYLGVLLSKPLLFFMLGVIFALIDGNVSTSVMQTGGIPLLTQLVLVIVALIIAGLAPFSLLKHAPLLPTGADSHDSQPSSGFGTSAVVGAGMGALGERERQHERSDREARTDDKYNAREASRDAKYAQRRIQSSYAGHQNTRGSGPQQTRTSSPVAGAGGSGGTGGQQQLGRAAALAGSAGPSAGAAAGAAAATGTTAGAAAAGQGAGIAAGPWGVAAQAAVAAANKVRSAAHTRHAPEVDDDVIKGGDD